MTAAKAQTSNPKAHVTGMSSVCVFSHLSSLPGTALFRFDTQQVFIDRYAAQLLGLGDKAKTLEVCDILHYLGRRTARRFLASMRLVKDQCPSLNDIVDGQSANNTNLRFTVPQGLYQGTVLYVRMTAFYQEADKAQGILFNFSRGLPNRLAMLPEALSLQSDFNWLIDENILMFNSNYYQHLGYVKQEQELILDFDVWEHNLIHPQDRPLKEKLAPLLNGTQVGDKFDICFRTLRLDGSYMWTRSVGNVIARDRSGKALRIVGNNSYINEVSSSFERLRTRIYTDVLTGLKNRTYFTTHIQEFLSPQWQPIGIIFMDATALKLYNDYLGHVSGDRLLFSLARLLQECLDPSTEMIRLSGDELVALLPRCSAEQLAKVDVELIEALKERNSQAPLRMPVYFSHGCQHLDLNSALYYEQFWQNLPPSLQCAFDKDGLNRCLHCSDCLLTEVPEEPVLSEVPSIGAVNGVLAKANADGNAVVGQLTLEHVEHADQAKRADHAELADHTEQAEHKDKESKGAKKKAEYEHATTVAATGEDQVTKHAPAAAAAAKTVNNTVSDGEKICNESPRMKKLLHDRWEQWQPLQAQQEQAAELFFQALHQADLLMQKAKKQNHDAHYGLIKIYIEGVLKREIDLTDKRVFSPVQPAKPKVLS